MSGFTAEWLSLREPYDLVARNATVLAAVAGSLGSLGAVSVVDLACGTGATLRALSRHLPSQQHWRLVDNDLGLLGKAAMLGRPPRLTVRRVAGPSPARVIIDPNGRLPPTARVLAADGIRRLVITAAGTRSALPGGVESVALDAGRGELPPSTIVAALAARGFRRLLVEGGADTISRFLAARCLDRLHVLIAPIILGAGRSSLTLPPVERVEQAMRAPMRVHVLGDEVLLDCDLGAQRVSIGRAKKST